MDQRFSHALMKLRSEYHAARRACDDAAPISAAAEHGRNADVCRYCLQRWQRWEGSELDGHARCIVTQGFKDVLVDTLRSNPGLQQDVVAAFLGVNVSYLRSWRKDGRATRCVPGVLQAWKKIE